jgi:hypothetical protein
MEKLSILKNFDHRQLYRFFVDGQFYAKENGWYRYEKRQPGCIEGMSLAYAHMIDNFDLPNGITLDYISKLHDLVFKKIDRKLRKNRYPGEIREFRISFLVRKRATSLEGLKELLAERELTEAFKKDIEGCFNADDLMNAIINGKKIRFVVETGYLPPELNKASLDKAPKDLYLKARAQVKKNITDKTLTIINNFNEKIDLFSGKEKLYFIINCIKDLERLHPFVDGNTRVFITILLNHLLLLHGFYPVIFEEPSIFDARTTDEIAEEIHYGQDLVKKIIENPASRIFGHSIDDEDEQNISEVCELMSALIEKIKQI